MLSVYGEVMVGRHGQIEDGRGLSSQDAACGVLVGNPRHSARNRITPSIPWRYTARHTWSIAIAGDGRAESSREARGYLAVLRRPTVTVVLHGAPTAEVGGAGMRGISWMLDQSSRENPHMPHIISDARIDV